MTQEEKELLLKDLCCRLPYRTLISIGGDGNKYRMEEIRNALIGIDTFKITIDGYDIEHIKPYLFPLSDMTEEQRKEFIQCAGYETREEENGYHYETYYYDLVGHENVMFTDCDGIDWLNENHFDYRGLIPKGLAINCTNLNIY